MNPTPESQSTRPQLHQRHSIASVSTIRADPFVDDRYRHPYNGQNAVGLFPGSASGSQAPPIPPARSSSLRGIPEPDFISNPPGSPLTRHVPSVQVIHPTPTKKKSRPRSTASGDTATAGSPLQRAASRASELDLEDTGGDPDKEEAKRARAREKGRERQRRKRERDKVKSGKPERKSTYRRSSSNLTISNSASVPSSVSSTYSALPHSHSMYSLSISPNASFTVSTSSSSLSGQSSPNNAFSPGLPPNALWTSKTRRPSAAPPPATHLVVGSPPPKRRKSEAESEDFRHGLGVSVPLSTESLLPRHTEGDETIRQRPRPRRTVSSFTEASSVTSAVETECSEWGARSPTPPPIPQLPAEQPISSQGHFFASTVIQACAVSGLADVLHKQLKLGKTELEGLRNDLGTIYDRWAKGALEQDMGKVSLVETMDRESATPQRPRADTISGPPGSPTLNAHTRTRSLSSASMLARGLILNPVPGPPSHISANNKWDSPRNHGPGSDSPTHSNLQTPNTGQGTSFIIPNHDPVPIMNMQAQAHWRSQTDPTSNYNYRMDWRPNTGVLESPLTMTKGGRPPTTATTATPINNGQQQSGGSNITPPHHPSTSGAKPTPDNNTATPLNNMNNMPHPHQPHYAYTQMSNHVHHPIPQQYQHQNYAHPISQPNFIPSHPYDSAPWTPAGVPRPGQFGPTQLAMHPFTPPTPMPLKGGGEAPMYYHPSFLTQHANAVLSGTPQNMMMMGGNSRGVDDGISNLSNHLGPVLQTPMKGMGGNGHVVKDGKTQSDALVMG